MRLRIDMRPEPQRRPNFAGPFKMVLDKKDLAYRKGLTLAILNACEHVGEFLPCLPCKTKGTRAAGFCTKCKGLGAQLVIPFPSGLLRVDLSFKVARDTEGDLPDIDNLTKAVLDTCNELLWTDDSQVRSGLQRIEEGRPCFLGIEIRKHAPEGFDNFEVTDGYSEGAPIVPVPRKKAVPAPSAKNARDPSSDVPGS